MWIWKWIPIVCHCLVTLLRSGVSGWRSVHNCNRSISWSRLLSLNASDLNKMGISNLQNIQIGGDQEITVCVIRNRSYKIDHENEPVSVIWYTCTWNAMKSKFEGVPSWISLSILVFCYLSVSTSWTNCLYPTIWRRHIVIDWTNLQWRRLKT